METVTPDIDDVIESYDFDSDALLQGEFVTIHQDLCRDIAEYDRDNSQYGDIVFRHLERTSRIGEGFLKTLGFSSIAARNFYYANLLQDIGKIHPEYTPQIWTLPHRPNEEERAEKRLHTARGPVVIDTALKNASEELRKHPHIHAIKAIQLYHHEHINGKGRHGIKGNEMGNAIKAICIIDAFDGDMIRRPHQPKKRTPQEALERMKTAPKYNGAFDAEMLDRFSAFIKQHITEKEPQD